MAVGEGQTAFLEVEEMAPSPGHLPLSTLLEYPQFWLVFFALMMEQMGVSTCVMISDAVCFKILGGARHKYGQQRLWGTVGMGVMGVVSGALVDVASLGGGGKNYLPAVLLCLTFMCLDVLVVARMTIPQRQDNKFSIGDVGNVVRHPEVVLFLVTVYVMGSTLGIVWVFKLMMVEDVALEWDPNFPTLKLLQGINVGLETFGGELPFFFLSGRILQKLGHRMVLGVSLLSLALRCTLYYAVSNPWYFLPIELLNGLSYGLFHAAMASYASLIAPPGAQATLQSIVRASFSAGLSTAGVLGGVTYHHLGGSMVFLVMGMFNFAFTIVYAVLQLLIAKFCAHMKESGYKAPPSSTSTSDTSGTDEPNKEPLMEPA